jgi:plasmid stabilization system protein ParE
MVRRWIVRPLAESDIDQAAHWYEDQRPGLGLRFLDVVDLVMDRIRTAPLQFPSIAANVRRALLHTFPYAVYFRVTEETIIVLAVLHLRRDPRAWRARG